MFHFLFASVLWSGAMGSRASSGQALSLLIYNNWNNSSPVIFILVYHGPIRNNSSPITLIRSYLIRSSWTFINEATAWEAWSSWTVLNEALSYMHKLQKSCTRCRLIFSYLICTCCRSAAQVAEELHELQFIYHFESEQTLSQRAT